MNQRQGLPGSLFDVAGKIFSAGAGGPLLSGNEGGRQLPRFLHNLPVAESIAWPQVRDGSRSCRCSTQESHTPTTPDPAAG